MRTELLGLLLALIMLIPGAAALPGYYESFNDANDVNAADPVAEPTTWYTYTHEGTGIVETLNGKVSASCGSGSGCGGAAVFTLANAVTSTQTWSFDVDVSLHRTVLADRPTQTIEIRNAANPSGILVSQVSFSDNTHVQFGHICSPFTTSGITTGISGLDFAGHVSFTYTPSTTTLSVTDLGGTCTSTSVNYQAVTKLDFNANTQLVSGSSTLSSWDNLVWNDGSGATYTLPTTPLPSPGVSALVTQAWTGSQSSIEFRWLLSTNDPNPTVGDFTYKILLNGLSIATDTITGADGDGQRYNLVVFTGSGGIGLGTYTITATDRGLTSEQSCAVQVTDAQAGDSDSCGEIGAQGTTFTTPTDTAAGLRGFCSGLMGDSSGSLFLCGLILAAFVFFSVIAAFGALGHGSMGTPSLISGLIFGLGEAIFNVISGIWGIGAFVLMALLAAGIVLFFLRKMFFSGSGKQGEEQGG